MAEESSNPSPATPISPKSTISMELSKWIQWDKSDDESEGMSSCEEQTYAQFMYLDKSHHESAEPETKNQDCKFELIEVEEKIIIESTEEPPPPKQPKSKFVNVLKKVETPPTKPTKPPIRCRLNTNYGRKRSKYSLPIPSFPPFSVWWRNLDVTTRKSDIECYLRNLGLTAQDIRFGRKQCKDMVAYIDFFTQSDLKKALVLIDNPKAPLILNRRISIDINEGIQYDRNMALKKAKLPKEYGSNYQDYNNYYYDYQQQNNGYYHHDDGGYYNKQKRPPPYVNKYKGGRGRGYSYGRNTPQRQSRFYYNDGYDNDDYSDSHWISPSTYRWKSDARNYYQQQNKSKRFVKENGSFQGPYKRHRQYRSYKKYQNDQN